MDFLPLIQKISIRSNKIEDIQFGNSKKVVRLFYLSFRQDLLIELRDPLALPDTFSSESSGRYHRFARINFLCLWRLF